MAAQSPVRFAAQATAAVGGVLVLGFTALTTVPLVADPDPMLGLELLVALPLMAVGMTALIASVAIGRAWRAARAWSLGASISMLLLGVALIAMGVSGSAYGALKLLDVAPPWVVDVVLPWLVAALGALLLVIAMRMPTRGP